MDGPPHKDKRPMFNDNSDMENNNRSSYRIKNHPRENHPRDNMNRDNMNRGDRENMNRDNMNRGERETMNRGERENMNRDNMNRGDNMTRDRENMNRDNMNRGERENMNRGERDNMNRDNMNRGERENMNRGERENMNRDNMNRGDMNRDNMNRGDNMNRDNMNRGDSNRDINRGDMNRDGNRGDGNRGDMNREPMNESMELRKCKQENERLKNEIYQLESLLADYQQKEKDIRRDMEKRNMEFDWQKKAIDRIDRKSHEKIGQLRKELRREEYRARQYESELQNLRERAQKDYEDFQRLQKDYDYLKSEKFVSFDSQQELNEKNEIIENLKKDLREEMEKSEKLGGRTKALFEIYDFVQGLFGRTVREILWPSSPSGMSPLSLHVYCLLWVILFKIEKSSDVFQSTNITLEDAEERLQQINTKSLQQQLLLQIDGLDMSVQPPELQILIPLLDVEFTKQIGNFRLLSFKDYESVLLAYYYIGRLNPALSISVASRDILSTVNQNLQQFPNNSNTVNQLINMLQSTKQPSPVTNQPDNNKIIQSLIQNYFPLLVPNSLSPNFTPPQIPINNTVMSSSTNQSSISTVTTQNVNELTPNSRNSSEKNEYDKYSERKRKVPSPIQLQSTKKAKLDNSDIDEENHYEIIIPIKRIKNNSKEQFYLQLIKHYSDIVDAVVLRSNTDIIVHAKNYSRATKLKKVYH
jgi:hypothetical protein